MSMALSALGRILLVSRACGVELSVWIGVPVLDTLDTLYLTGNADSHVEHCLSQ